MGNKQSQQPSKESIRTLFHETNESDKPAELTRTASGAARASADASFKAGIMHQVNAEYQQAEEIYSKLLSGCKDYHRLGQVACNLGLVYELRQDIERDRDPDKANEYFKMAIDLDPTLAIPHYLLGCQYQKCDKRQAMLCMREAKRLDPKDELIAHKLECFLFRSGGKCPGTREVVKMYLQPRGRESQMREPPRIPDEEKEAILKLGSPPGSPGTPRRTARLGKKSLVPEIGLRLLSSHENRSAIIQPVALNFSSTFYEDQREYGGDTARWREHRSMRVHLQGKSDRVMGRGTTRVCVAGHNE